MGIETGAAAKGQRYAEARTQSIIDDGGTAVMSLTVESPRGGTLSYSIQALVRVPFEDTFLQVDDEIVLVDFSPVREWKRRKIEVATGLHTMSWVHRKNPSDANEEDLAGKP